MKPTTPAPLTPAQKKLVTENLGLVGVHLNRRLADQRNRPGGAETDHWADLYQDGCLGLIQAARSFDPAQRSRFAPYALHRIHHEVSMSLRRSRSSIRIPERAARPGNDNRVDRRRRARDRKADPNSPTGRGPRVVNRDPGLLDRIETQETEVESPGPTIGDWVLLKLNAAAQVTLGHVGQTPNCRNDRAGLAKSLIEQRLLVPEETARASLRDIAEQHGSSYGRAAHCETILVTAVRRLLSSEAEFTLLRRAARGHDRGMSAPIDADLRARLSDAAVEQAVSFFHAVSSERQVEVLLSVLKYAGVEVDAYFRAHLTRLDPAARTAWMAFVTGAGSIASGDVATPSGDRRNV